MILNDPHMMEQASNTCVQEVEPLYWVLEDALYGGKQGRAISILKMFLYIARYNEKILDTGLQIPHRERLKSITHEIYGGGPVVQKNSITMKPAIESRNIPFKKENELKKYLVGHPNILRDSISKSLKITGTEVETDNEYRCDIVAENDDFFYPIELKIVQGNHSVVSQCSKYCFYFYRTLRYNWFKNIQGIVIINGADAWSINELRREGHWVYIIQPEDDGHISLRKIDDH